MKTWSEEETMLLIENYNKVTNTELQKMIPNKSQKGIYKKAYKMGLRKCPDIEFLNKSEARKCCKGARWNGGVRVTRKGYRQLLIPDHPRADSSGYVMEHIVVWEQATGAPVPPNCCIHHINGKKSDNDPNNLCMMLHSAHTAFHNTGRHCSDNTKAKMSKKATDRFKNKKNHPFYKEVDVQAMLDMRNQGAKVTDVCKAFGITKSTYYAKLKEGNQC